MENKAGQRPGLKKRETPGGHSVEGPRPNSHTRTQKQSSSDVAAEVSSSTIAGCPNAS